MFDLFGGATADQVDDVSKHSTIQILALGTLLLSKGIITQEEWKQSIAIATAQVDQKWQERKDRMREEFEKEHPGRGRELWCNLRRAISPA